MLVDERTPARGLPPGTEGWHVDCVAYDFGGAVVDSSALSALVLETVDLTAVLADLTIMDDRLGCTMGRRLYAKRATRL